ncbi:MAG: molecular chaperone DnaJ [Pseudomonadota bacterium]
MADLYQTLGVSRTATADEIRKAFKRLAMKHHPDRNPDDPEAENRFKEVKQAYDVLSDAEKRAAYDRFGDAALNGGMGGPGGGGGGFEDLNDVFNEIFGDVFGGGARRGGGGRRSRVMRGADIAYDLELELEEAVFGTTVEIEVPNTAQCGTCDGSGAEPGSEPETCETCGGRGQVRVQQGFFSLQQPCPRCGGRGVRITDPCRTCDGQGRVEESRRLSVKVPAGVDDGDRIRLSGEGETGRNGGPPGDLYVEIRTKEHPLFTRDGRDLHCEIPVSYATAVLGGQVEAPTLSGPVSLKVPVGTQAGRVFRMSGKGVRPVRGGATGDLYCRVTVETPVNLTGHQKDLLRKFEESLQEDTGRHSPRSRGWLDGVKEFFDDLRS